MTPVSHTNYSPKFKDWLSVSIIHLGLRRDKGVLKKGGKVVGEEKRLTGGEEEQRRGGDERRQGEEERRRGGAEERRRGGAEERRRGGEEKRSRGGVRRGGKEESGEEE